MNNAFILLGAEPTDSTERLQELLDEKELLLDDISEVQAAYADLTNPKKRIKHEITYFCNDALSDFNKLVNREFTEAPTLGKIANILVELGWWFEADNDDLFDKIYDARSEGGFVQIEDIDVISSAVDEIKQSFLHSVNTYLDRLTEKSLVGIFNQIVKINEYESFFIDELLAHYELMVSESLREREKKCKSAFDEIERLCDKFNRGATLSLSLNDKVTAFGTLLKNWDNYAQPLQVNMQRRGGQHEDSGQLVHDIRNRIIELCNISQEKLQKSIESFEKTSLSAQLGVGSRYQAISARDMLEKKLNDSIAFTKALISLTDILSQVFAELEITAERLKKDRTQLVDLQDALTKLRNQVPGAEQRASYVSSQTSSRTTTQSYSSNNSSTNSERNGYRILLGALAAICGILMIVGFSIENVAMGIAFIILGLAFGIGCGMFYILKENKKALLAIVVAPIVLILAVVVPIASCNSGNFEGELKPSNFSRAFEFSGYGGQYGASYSISPKDIGYAKCSRSSNEITVTIECKYTGGSSGGRTFTKRATLKKSSGYTAKGSIDVSGYFTFSSCSVKVTAVNGYVYLE